MSATSGCANSFVKQVGMGIAADINDLQRDYDAAADCTPQVGFDAAQHSCGAVDSCAGPLGIWA